MIGSRQLLVERHSLDFDSEGRERGQCAGTYLSCRIYTAYLNIQHSMKAAAFAAALAASCSSTKAALSLAPAFGVTTHFTEQRPGEHHQIAVGGIRYVRQDLAWWTVEGPCGVYNFTQYDILMSDLQAEGLTPYLTFNFVNQCYDGGQSPHSPEGIAAFTRFATAAVQRYAGKGIVWEIYNEPNLGTSPNCTYNTAAEVEEPVSRWSVEPRGGAAGLRAWFPCPNVTDYIALAKSVAIAIKAQWPAEIVIAPAASQGRGTDQLDVPFHTAIIASGLLDHLDALSFHPYTGHSPEAKMVEVQQLRGMLEAAGYHNFPIIAGEWGYSTASIPHNGGPLANVSTQRDWTPRMAMAMWAVGVNLTIFYDYHDDGTNASYIEDRFGLTEYTYNNASLPHLPKPSYTALQTLWSLFPSTGCKWVGALPIIASRINPVTGQPAQCYGGYWDCGFMSPAFAAWCDAPAAEDGWSTALSFPYTWPGGNISARQPVASPNVCLQSYGVTGMQQGLVCTAGDNTWQLPSVSGTVLYLRGS